VSGAPPRAPRLRPTLERTVTPDGRLVLAGGPDGDVHELEGEAGQLDTFLSLLDGTRTVEQVVSELGDVSRADVIDAVAELAAAGLVDDAEDDRRRLSTDELERFDRQLRYFGDLATGFPRAQAQARLSESTVAVLGLGGLGGMAALLLTACGVGRIVAVDDDRVELSNLARQVAYDEGDLGRLKIQAAGRRLRRLHGRVGFEGHARAIRGEDDVSELVRDADLVIAAADRPAMLIGDWVGGACFTVGVPYIEMSQHPPLVRIGPLYVPGRTGCHACRRASLAPDDPLGAAILAGLASESPAATYAPTSALIGALVANDAIAYLTELHEPATLGAAIVIDVRTMEIQRSAVPRRADCLVCGPAH
jgi:molybdopterin-synthase adenylyltransferase